jgi:hypothetical protein
LLIEHMFGTMLFMAEAFDDILAAVTAVAGRVEAVVSAGSDELVGLRRVMDRLEAGYARLAASVSAAELATLCGSSLRRANQTARLGAALVSSEVLAAAVRDGRVGLEQAEALAPIAAHPEFEARAEQIVDAAGDVSLSKLRAEVNGWLALSDPEQLRSRAQRQRELRSVQFSVDDDGMTVLRGRFTPEDGRVLRNTVEHLVRGSRDDSSGRSREHRAADALVELAAAFAAGTVAGGREAPQLLVTIDSDVLAGRVIGSGRVATGETLTADAVRRLACDAQLAPVLRRRSGEILNLGRSERTASTAQYRALVVRDGGCVVPGCDRPPGWCQAHHIRFWDEMGGPTDLENLALVCNAHHHQIHDDGWLLASRQTDAGLRWSLTPPRPEAGRPRCASALGLAEEVQLGFGSDCAERDLVGAG